MDELTPSDLKTNLHSKRANLYYVQRYRVVVKGARVEYIIDREIESLEIKLRGER